MTNRTLTWPAVVGTLVAWGPECRMDQDLAARIAPMVPEITAIRRDIHAHPELSMPEHPTPALVADRLRSWRIEVAGGVGALGGSGPCVAACRPRAPSAGPMLRRFRA